MEHTLAVRLADDRHALPRLLSRLHALGLDVPALTVDGRAVRLTVRGAVGAPRLSAALARLVDVLEVRPVVALPTVHRVTWQASPSVRPREHVACRA